MNCQLQFFKKQILRDDLEGYTRYPTGHLPRRRNTGKRFSSCRLAKQRLINALLTEIHEGLALNVGTETLYRTKFRRCYREASLEEVYDHDNKANKDY